MTDDHITFMRLALQEAEKAAARGEVPVGAVLVHTATKEIIAIDGNRTLEQNDVTAHAEALVIRQAGKKLQVPRLIDCDLYVTLEPCPLCAQAISFARLKNVYYGASDPKGGGVEQGPKIFEQPTCFHRPTIAKGFLADECGEILKSFFRARR